MESNNLYSIFLKKIDTSFLKCFFRYAIEYNIITKIKKCDTFISINTKLKLNGYSDMITIRKIVKYNT